MKEKRKKERLKEFNEITTTIISGEKNFYNYSEDISVYGAKIRGNIPLPVDTFLKIDLTLIAHHLSPARAFGRSTAPSLRWLYSYSSRF